jgi:hypothetical protein
MTASTRTVTLSRVMPSWAGTGIVMICMLTLSRRSAIGINIVNPGPRTRDCTRPNRKTTPRSNCLTTRRFVPSHRTPRPSVAASAYRVIMIVSTSAPGRHVVILVTIAGCYWR